MIFQALQQELVPQLGCVQFVDVAVDEGRIDYVFKLILSGGHGQFAGFNLFFQFTDVFGVFGLDACFFPGEKHQFTSFLRFCNLKFAGNSLLMEVYPKRCRDILRDMVLAIGKCNRI